MRCFLENTTTFDVGPLKIVCEYCHTPALDLRRNVQPCHACAERIIPRVHVRRRLDVTMQQTSQLILVLIMAFTIFGKTFGQQKQSTGFDKSSDEMRDISYLIDQSFPFVEDMLQEHGEFFPFSFSLSNDNTVVAVGRHDGDENPDSNVVIEGLKEVLRLEAKNRKIKAISIFYDVRITDPKTNQKSDAVAVFVEHKDSVGAFTFYYPYELTDKEVLFGDCFANAAAREVFTK